MRLYCVKHPKNRGTRPGSTCCPGCSTLYMLRQDVAKGVIKEQRWPKTGLHPLIYAGKRKEV